MSSSEWIWMSYNLYKKISSAKFRPQINLLSPNLDQTVIVLQLPPQPITLYKSLKKTKISSAELSSMKSTFWTKKPHHWAVRRPSETRPRRLWWRAPPVRTEWAECSLGPRKSSTASLQTKMMMSQSQNRPANTTFSTLCPKNSRRQTNNCSTRKCPSFSRLRAGSM